VQQSEPERLKPGLQQKHQPGAIWIRPDDKKQGLRVVVDQLATLKADQKFYLQTKVSQWPPNYRQPGLRGTAGVAWMSVTIPDRPLSYSRRSGLNSIRVSGSSNLSNSAMRSEKTSSRCYK